tara:strand:- start:26032 stop:26898 length:867 start_codon:yes stop_codon:yes gene_type:complete
MDKTFKIENSLYLTPHETYFNKDNYPDFQSQFIEFKSKLVKESRNSINSTYYKFGDGDYYILSKQSVGTSKPGLRDIKKSVDLNKDDLFYKEIKDGSQQCDNYLCEIKFFNLFKEVMGDKKVSYPAEFAYGIISSKWVFKNFKKIGLIGSNEKLKIINELMKYEEYQSYLGINNFSSYIGIPQVYALSKSKSIYKKIKKKIENSDAEIFLLGIGHVQNTLLYKLKKHSKVPMVCVGCGIDAIAGLVDIRRPYFGNWNNFQIKNLSLYEKVLDPMMKTTMNEDVIRYLN